MDKKTSIPWNLWSETWVDQVPQPIVLPSSLEPHHWKRFHEIGDISPILHDSTDSPDLFINNQHLLHSKFIKWFCSSLTILNYCHEENGKKWQGWHHIYSPNKSRRESDHNPHINPDGKYMIRLFFMGFWRCLIIDDTIPLDKEDNPLLPRTQNINELWPILLAKALWQIASLTKIEHHEFLDFNPFFNLTGLPYLSQDITQLSLKDRWNLLIKYVPTNIPSKNIQLDDVNEPEDEKKRNSKKESKQVEKKELKPLNTITFLYLHEDPDDKLSKPPKGYPLYIESTSDHPEDSTQIKPPIESWKLPRWVPWAVRQGIIDPKESLSPIRRILILNREPNVDWFDFNEFNGCPMDLHVLFKPDYFPCTRSISNIPHGQKNVIKPDVKTSKKKSSKMEGSNDLTKRFNQRSNDSIKNLHFLHELNEPLYLFVDSIDSKLFLFNYSVYEESNSSSLIIEKACWFNQNFEESNLLKIQTRGSASRIICLTPGRHFLKIFCQSRTYYLTISSDKVFHIGRKQEIQDLMTTESEMTRLLAKSVQRTLEMAFQSFGLENHSMALRKFYQSYLPQNRGLSVGLDGRRIHEDFKEEFLNLIEKKFEDYKDFRMIRALRIFFIDPDFGKRLLHHHDGSSHEIAIVKIQSLFRMQIVKKYLRIHDSNHEEHEMIKEILKEMMELFDEDTMCRLIRNFINRIDFGRFYPCSYDFDKVLEIQKIKGMVSMTSSKWIPIVRQCFIVPENEIVFARLDLFVDLPFHTLRSFDNDTTKEIQRVGNFVVPFRYKRNQSGFTVLGYGRSDENKSNEIEWTLNLITIKGSPQFQTSNNSEISINPGVHELSNIYIPNATNCLTKAILKVSNPCTVSIRLQSSYPEAKIKLIISSETSGSLNEVSGGSVVFLPVVKLLNCEEEYYIHAVVIGDSWPLTETEWRFVEETKKEREKMISTGKSVNSSGSFVKDKMEGKSGISSVEFPFWSLQALSDPGINLKVYEDNKREMEILKKKKLWKSEDSNRLERGRNLQEIFREANCIQLQDSEEYEYDDEEIRTLSPPQDNRRLPPLDLSNFRDESDVRSTSQEQMHRDNLFEYQKKSVHLMQHLEFMMMKSLRI